MSLVLILATIAMSANAQARVLADGLKISPTLAFHETKFANSNGEAGDFILTGNVGEIEITMRGTRLDSATQARDFSKVEFASVAHLYSQKRSPYEGQITSVTQCDPQFKAKFLEVNSMGKTWRAVSGGANDRNTFGACRAEHIARWARYFNVVDDHLNMVIAVRMFAKLPSAKPVHIKKIEKIFDGISKNILVKEGG